jgi:uncharacterized coiled-coil protein SlyX
MSRKKTTSAVTKETQPDLLGLLGQLMQRVQELEATTLAQQDTIKNLNTLIEQKFKNESQTTLNRSQLNLTSELQYSITSNNSGLSITEKDRPLFVINRTGALGIGVKTAKTQGAGSLHIRANYPSEASIPSTGVNSTRGLLVESDADDEKAYAFRVVSRQNRQGLNVTGDGSVFVGIMNHKKSARVSVYQPNNNKPTVSLTVPSKYYNSNMLEMHSAGMNNAQYNFLELSNQCSNNNTSDQVVFRVSGTGAAYTDRSWISNQTGYAEYFEWEDVVKRSEDRTGIAVTLTKTGKIRPATDGDRVLGVVTSAAAVVGHSAWNNWHGKYIKTRVGSRCTTKYQILEWQNHDNTVESYINSSLPGDYPVPDNAVNYETDASGADMYSDQVNSEYCPTQVYQSRENRRFPLVVLLGRVIMYKGQVTGTNWIKISDVSDETECWIIM